MMTKSIFFTFAPLLASLSVQAETLTLAGTQSPIPPSSELRLAAPPAESSPAADNAAELAKKLANPIANLISLPMIYNYDRGYGPDGKGSVSRLNIQPVAPFSLNDDWNLITRTIIPLVENDDIPVPGQNDSGLGDILASQFFSPKEPTESGWIWGAGPAWLIPSATDSSLGGERWAAGPTAVFLKQTGPWTYGGLFNHLWSFAGDEDRADINATYLQPFMSYTTSTYTTLGISTESTYDWDSGDWSIPINCTVSQLFKIGKMPIQFTCGPRYWVESPEFGPEGWGFRLGLTFLFPK